MTIREELEERELQSLSPYAAFSRNSRGRDVFEEPCAMRPIYQRDRDRILHCKSFRRLKHKTQVFFNPEGDHYRTRLTHTLEVSQIARTIAKALQLNEELTEAIALGHDLGHTPFGHSGERVLNALYEGGFSHSEQSVRVVERLEKDGAGLNLSWEVRDGIRNHQTKGVPATLEGKVVRLSDKIAYINHDVDDAIRGGLMCEEAIPAEYRELLGDSVRSRLNTLINDVILSSKGTTDITMSPEIAQGMKEFRKFMFETVYKNARTVEQENRAQEMLERLYDHFNKDPQQMPQQYLKMLDEGEEEKRVICDYISGMTDQYAILVFEDIFVPKAWTVI